MSLDEMSEVETRCRCKDWVEMLERRVIGSIHMVADKTHAVELEFVLSTPHQYQKRWVIKPYPYSIFPS